MKLHSMKCAILVDKPQQEKIESNEKKRNLCDNDRSEAVFDNHTPE